MPLKSILVGVGLNAFSFIHDMDDYSLFSYSPIEVISTLIISTLRAITNKTIGFFLCTVFGYSIRVILAYSSNSRSVPSSSVF